jgi:type IV secretion system protein VirB4
MGEMLSRKVLESETPVSQYVPYSHHVSDTIISTKGAEYLSVWKFEGRAHQAASDDDLFQWLDELNNLVKGIGTENVSFWTHVVRRRVYEYPDSEFNNVFCRQLDAKYRESFTGYNLMVNDLYITIVFRPVADKVLSFFAKKEKETPQQKQERQERCISALNDINRTFGKALRSYGPELLGVYDRNGHAYSSALEFLAFLVNGEWMPMPICRDRFCNYMVMNRPFFSKWGEIGEVRTTRGNRMFGMVEVGDYDEGTEPGQLNVLLELPFEFVLTQSFSCLSLPAAKGFLQKHKQHLIDSKDVAITQVQEMDVVLNDLQAKKFIMGEHHATVTVFGSSADDVREHMALVNSALLEVSVAPKNVDLALEAGYWAQLPAVWEYRPRPSPITSQNFLCFSSLHNFMTGKPNGNPWGPAVTILKTVSGTPLYFNFHHSKLDEDVTDKRLPGTTALYGKTGTGKTVFLTFLLAQAQKFKPRMVLFDKDRGMEIAVRAMGGRYFPLQIGTPTGWNPFQLDPTAKNLDMMKQLVKKLASIGGEVNEHDDKEISLALDGLMTKITDKRLRRLSLLLQFLPNPETYDPGARPTVHARLLKWTEGHEYGWVFDNPTDALDLNTHQMYGFDITEFLDAPEVRTPIMMYLIYRTQAMIDGTRFAYVFDEFWKPLDDEHFEDLARNKVKTIRKENGLFIFCTQEPGDALSKPVGATLTQQCSTVVCLPNQKAVFEDYKRACNFTEHEFEAFKELSEDGRRFLIKQGANSAIAEFDLTGFDDELLVLSGTPDNAELCEQVIEEVGEDPAVWLPVFYERVRMQRSQQ